MTGSEPIVHTPWGPVRGVVIDGVRRFLGIPYAETPVGRARFERPRPHVPWLGVRDASTFGATQPQPNRSSFGALDMSPFFGPGWIRGAEALTVNVWTPANAVGAPVLVFVHGGAFITGSPRASLYDASSFARDGLVTVTLTYRLGATGFLRLPDTDDDRGLLDVTAALAWVRDTIADFGGDPGRVTIAGQSAGATLVAGLFALSEAHDLFHRAIMASGSGTGALVPEQADRVALALGTALDRPATATGLGDVPDHTLIDALPHLTRMDLRTRERAHPLGGLTPFSPVAEYQPADVVRAGRGASVGLLIGTLTEEGRLYVVPSGALETTVEQELRSVVASVGRAGDEVEAVIDRYRALHPSATPGDLRALILTDAFFRSGTDNLASAHAGRGHQCYEYEFGWGSPALPGRLGAAHTVDLPFIFDRVDAADLHGPAALLGSSPAPQKLADTVHATWVNFIRRGDPGWASSTPTERYIRRIDDA